MINKVLLMEFFKDDDIKVVDKNFYIKSQMKNDVIKYITILEEENERLKEKENKLQEKFKDWKKEIEKERKHYLCDRTDCCGRIKNSRKYNSIYQELKTYKSRCEKANQYIKKNTHEYKMFNEELGHFSNLTNISIDKNNKVFINDLLKILGGDE